jgi:hypothetical protein
MIRRVGNQLRESSASAEQLVADNLPDLFPVEEWRAFYWTMNADGRVVDAHSILHLPQGVAAVTRPIQIGENGVIEHVRRWGVTLRGGILEEVGFDPTPFLTHDRALFPTDDAEALSLVTKVTHFDLPGFFILASEEHPFLLFDPSGDLKGSDTHWYTHAGALAFLVTDGRLATSFGLTWEKDKVLYQKVMRVLNQEMENKKRAQDAE